MPSRRDTSLLLIVLTIVATTGLIAAPLLAADTSAPANANVAKTVLDIGEAGENLLDPDGWRGWQKGFRRDGKLFVCENGADLNVQRGATQTVVLDQTQPEPIVAVAFSRSEGVSGSSDAGYSLYLDLVYVDGDHLWGQTANFSTGTHDWQRRHVVVLPTKPIKQVSFHMLFRSHGGSVRFRDPVLQVVRAPEGAALFDGVPVMRRGNAREGFQLRDVAAGSDFVHLDKGREALGVRLDYTRSQENGATFLDVTIADTTGRDRAVTLVYAIPVAPDDLDWLDDPRRTTTVGPGLEYVNASRFRAGSNGRLSKYPLGAVANDSRGVGLGIDMARPAFFRVGYNSGTGELYLAYDIGLAPEKPTAKVRLCRFEFDREWGFRAALARYYELFPDAFRCRTPEQGLWMPFAKISEVTGWEDFGFKFKEGDNETEWDDRQGITTFRYTEPMTWWMRMPTEMPRTLDAALAEARRLAEKGDRRAKALLTSSYHDPQGKFPARLIDTPWCNGAVWSMNSMPGVSGKATSFSNKWNPSLREKLYGPNRPADLDGEYIDSSEGYVTDELNFRRDHFADCDTPLVFSPHDYRPAIFRGLIAFEYIRAIADDVHAMDKLMMANSTPIRLPWLAPLLEVLGTETDWHRGSWAPMSDAEMLYRRAMCKGKPYCFLMNSRFEDFSHQLVEKYMKRSLAYGMFPGFFSHNAAEGHYFTRPELYGRDRPLFKKYVPLCKLVAEAGWEPITLARSDQESVHVERFGTRYLTVFNDGPRKETATVTFEGNVPKSIRELVADGEVALVGGTVTLTLESQDVAVLELD